MTTTLEATQANFKKVKTDELQSILRDDKHGFDETTLNIIRDELRDRGLDVPGGTAKSRAVENRLQDVRIVNTPKVVVTNIDMPFSSMISFMVKWAMAAVPAVLLLWLFWTIVTAVFSGLL